MFQVQLISHAHISSLARLLDLTVITSINRHSILHFFVIIEHFFILFTHKLSMTHDKQPDDKINVGSDEIALCV